MLKSMKSQSLFVFVRQVFRVLYYSAPIILTCSAFAATNDLSGLLQKGLFEEEANRNLDAASAAYETLVKQFDQDRQIGATAVFRLGEVYRKQNKTNEAVLQYERIIRDFAEQTTLVTLSRQNLVGLGANHASTEALEQKTSPPLATDAATNAELLSHIKSLSQYELRQVLPTLVPDQLLIKLLEQQQTEETKLAALSVHVGANYPDVIAVKKTLQKLDEQIAARMNGIIKALELRVAAASSTTLSENSGNGSQAASATVVDEEETEIRRIQEMIKNSPDLINGRAEGYGPLNTAALGGQLRVATFLLDNGADINKPTDGATPLQQAVKSGHKAMVELLAQRGANVNARDGAGATPLHIAAERGFLAVAEALVQWKADLNSRNSKANGEQTPLHWAARQGFQAMVTFLISKGAEIEAADASGNRALMLAAQFGRTDVVAALLKAGAQVNATNAASGATALAFAVGNGHLESIKTLLAAKADPNGGKNGPALFNAINNPTMMETLLAAGANPNVTNISGQPLLLSFIQQGDERSVELLIKHGADVNAKNNLRMTPLQMAVWRESVPLVSLLLTNGADVNAEGPADRNALHMANEAIEGYRPANPGNYGGNFGGGSRIPDRATAQRIAALLREHGAREAPPSKP